MLVSITLQYWSLALAHALKAYFYIDPIHCPQVWHPVRVVRKWVLFRLVSQIAYLQSAGKSEDLEKYHVDWAIVGWGLLQEVWNGVSRSHGDENRFAKEVKEMYEQDMWGEVSKGADMMVMEDEWRKLRIIADKGA